LKYDKLKREDGREYKGEKGEDYIVNWIQQVKEGGWEGI